MRVLIIGSISILAQFVALYFVWPGCEIVFLLDLQVMTIMESNTAKPLIAQKEFFDEAGGGSVTKSQVAV